MPAKSTLHAKNELFTLYDCRGLIDSWDVILLLTPWASRTSPAKWDAHNLEWFHTYCKQSVTCCAYWRPSGTFLVMTLLSILGHISLNNCPNLTNKGSFWRWGPLLTKNSRKFPAREFPVAEIRENFLFYSNWFVHNPRMLTPSDWRRWIISIASISVEPEALRKFIYSILSHRATEVVNDKCLVGWTTRTKFQSSVFCFLPQLILRLDDTNFFFLILRFIQEKGDVQFK